MEKLVELAGLQVLHYVNNVRFRHAYKLVNFDSEKLKWWGQYQNWNKLVKYLTQMVDMLQIDIQYSFENAWENLKLSKSIF